MKTLDWTAAVLCAIGVSLLAYKIIWGWPVGMVSNAMYIGIAWRKELRGLCAVEIFLVIINAVGWHHWAIGG